MTTHPYMPLFVDDFEAATAHLSLEEDGVYNRLLRLCWRTPGCSLPNDYVWIARKIRVAPEEFTRIAQPLLAEFFTLVRGRIIQRRLKREYDDISLKKSARKLAGKKGGSAKALKANANEPSNARVLLGDTRAFPDPYPDPEPYTTITNAPDWRQMIAEAKEAAGDAADLTRPAMHHAADLRALVEPKTGEPCTWGEVLDAIAMTAMRQRSKGALIPTWKWVQADAWALRDKRLGADAPPVGEVVPIRAGSSWADQQAAVNAEARRRVLED